MPPTRVIAAIAACAALAAPAAASAELIEIGHVDPAPVPSCPSRPCLVMSRTTGYQVGPNAGLMTVPKDGRIVAWTISLSKPSARQLAFFNARLGEATAQITVLGRRDKNGARKVMGQGDAQKLAPFFGSSPLFALTRSIVVKKGWTVALTVPTWAPVLAVGQPREVSWRASRAKGKCKDTGTQTAQVAASTTAQYFCLYRTARLAYTATMVADPTPTATTN